MLEEERKRASFDRKQLSYVIYGSKEKAEKFIERQHIIENDPIMRFDPAIIQRSRSELMNIHAKKLIRYTELFPQNLLMHNEKSLFTTEQMPLGLHDYMFLITLRNLCDDQQIKTILEPSERGQILGCYAQTELGHGSDVQNLMTTATYDPSNQTFIINTPETKAAKWWIGDLGVYCNHACVFAQLIIKNKKYGVHAFVVPIRDKDHKPFPGLEVGDIGPKMGFNCKDNGYIIFNNYRIPREYMLMKYHKVSPEGVYSKQGDEKITYATMLKIRAIIPKSVFFGISKGVVILTRFSLSRKQFRDNKGQEVPILNYQLQQEKVFPRIAESYATLFAKITVDELADFVFAEAKLHNRFNHLNETHTITSGVKAIITRDGLRGLEILRRAAGGHGYSSYSGIPTMISELTPSYTYQGEYTVLLLQVARYLMKCLKRLQKGKIVDSSSKYLESITEDPYCLDVSQPEKLANVDTIIKLFTHHSCQRVKRASQKLMEGLEKQLDAKTAWDQYAGIELTEAATAHTYLWLLNNFKAKIELLAKDEKVRAVLIRLFLLYGIEKLGEYSTSFYETGVVTSSTLQAARKLREKLFEQIRPDALTIVEAFEYTDHSLFTAIGTSDGKVYDKLLDWARNHNDVNKAEVKADLRKDLIKLYGELREYYKPKPSL